MCGGYIPPENPLKKSGWKTYTIGGVVAAAGALLALAEGVDWGSVFSAEGAAVVGAGIVFGRAIVAFFQKRGT